jgi:hypothetical protein
MPRELGPASVTLALAGTILLMSTETRAQSPCGSPEHPWVQVLASDASPAFEALLRAELGSRRIDLCSEQSAHAAPAIATVEISPQQNTTAIVVQVRDAMTAKRVERDVDLANIPKDGRPLTLALAADELLRASWAELALSNPPPPTVPVPPAVKEAVEAAVRPPSSRPHGAFGAMAVIEHYSGGQTLYGADVQGQLWVTRRLSAGVRLGLRSAFSASAPDGDVGATAFVAGLEAAVTATPPAWSWGVDAVARFDLERVSYVAVADAGNKASGSAASAFLVGAGARVFWTVAKPLSLVAEVLADVPIRPVQATDSGDAVVGLVGVGVQAALGARAVF